MTDPNMAKMVKTGTVPNFRVLAVFVLVGALCLLIYFPALRQFFLADDFINLGFVRHWRGSWLEFLNPARMYSDPVTQSRYKPFFVYLLALTNWAFGDHVLAYHALSLALHAAVATSVYALAMRLCPQRGRVTAFAAAVMFASWRLHSQTVVWVATVHRLLSTALVLWAVLCPYWKGRRWPLCLSGILFALALLLNSEVIVFLPMLLLFFVYYRFSRQRDGELSGRFIRATLLCGGIAAVYIVANVISSKFFPDDPIALVPHVDRVVLFLLDLCVPFRASLLAKGVAVGVWVAVAVVFREEAALLALACTLPSALLWACFSSYTLAPRYLYLAGTFGAIAMAQVLHVVAMRGGLFVTRPLQSDRLSRILFLTGVAAIVIANGRVIRSQDLVQYEYLSTVGRKLADVQAEVRRTGQRARVYISPRPMLRARDLAFFACDMDVVLSAAAATRVVDNEVTHFRRYLGPKLGYTYWYFPWFDAAWDGSQGREEPTSISVTQAWCEGAKP